jgi:hypothetical protein
MAAALLPPTLARSLCCRASEGPPPSFPLAAMCCCRPTSGRACLDLGLAQVVGGGALAPIGYNCPFAAPEQLIGLHCSLSTDIYRCEGGQLSWEDRRAREWRVMSAGGPCAAPTGMLSPSCLPPDMQLWPDAGVAVHAASGGEAGRLAAAARSRGVPAGELGAQVPLQDALSPARQIRLSSCTANAPLP